MQNDWESKFYKEFTEIEDIKNKVKRIHSDFNKLSKKVNQIEIQGLQEQINSLNDALLETQQLLARFFIHFTTDNIMTTALQQKPTTSREFANQLTIDAAHVRSQINTSNEPLLVAHNFSKKYYNEAEKLGIKFINIH